jgi:hypothetical protein
MSESDAERREKSARESKNRERKSKKGWKREKVRRSWQERP